MWDILLHYAFEQIFAKHTSAFEIGGHIVETKVPTDATPQAIGKATVVPSNDVDIDQSYVCYRPEDSPGRHYVQFGFNPFGPVIQKGAEEFLILTGHSNKRYD